MRRAHPTIALLGLAFTCCGASAGGAEPTRIALVIANSQYANLAAVSRCAPAAAAVRDALRGKGFEVIERNNLGRGEFDTAIGLLARRAAASPPAVAVLYFCGYAVEFNGRSFLLPTSAALAREHDVLTQGIVAKSVVDSLRRAPESAGFILIDAFAPANVPVGKLGRLADQIPVSTFAIIAASNDGPGDGPTAASLALREEMAGSEITVESLTNGLRRLLAKDANVTAQVIAASADAAVVTAPRREPPPVAAAPPPPPTPAPASSAAAPAATPPPAPAPAPMRQVMVDEEHMSEQDRRQVQVMLATMGYYAGRIDGAFGPETRAAIRRYQFEIKGELTGRLTAEQATRLVNSVR